MRRVVIVNDEMQQGYRHELSASVGRDFDPQFRPDLHPEANGRTWRVLRQISHRLPGRLSREVVRARKLPPSGRDCSLNYFGVHASQPFMRILSPIFARKPWSWRADNPIRTLPRRKSAACRSLAHRARSLVS